MAAATSTEASAHLATTTDLEQRVARIADPHTGAFLLVLWMYL